MNRYETHLHKNGQLKHHFLSRRGEMRYYFVDNLQVLKRESYLHVADRANADYLKDNNRESSYGAGHYANVYRENFNDLPF